MVLVIRMLCWCVNISVLWDGLSLNCMLSRLVKCFVLILIFKCGWVKILMSGCNVVILVVRIGCLVGELY